MCTLLTQTRRLLCNVPAIQLLALDTNQIGDAAMRGLASVVDRGALRSCKDVYLHCNRIGATGMTLLAEMISGGGCPELVKITLCTLIQAATRRCSLR